MLEAAVTAEPFDGGHRLKLRSVTGEEIGVELSADEAAALHAQLAAIEPTPIAEVQPAPAAPAPPRRRRR